ncbi:MAG: low affinity iron permease family protein [Bryobacteraceae bacterium]
MRDAFRKVAQLVAEGAGSPAMFLVGLGIVVAWVCTGPAFHYSDTWQLVINTCSSVVTFLMVFLIQNTQNRNARVVQLKLDELIRALHSARTELVQMEDLSDKELDGLRNEFQELKERAADGPEGEKTPGADASPDTPANPRKQF